MVRIGDLQESVVLPVFLLAGMKVMGAGYEDGRLNIELKKKEAEAVAQE